MNKNNLSEMLEAADRRFSEIGRFDGFAPNEVVWRVGTFGFVTDAEWNRVFDAMPEMVRYVYLLDSAHPNRLADWLDVYASGGVEALKAQLHSADCRYVYPVRTDGNGDV